MVDYGDDPWPDWWITWTRSWFYWWISATPTGRRLDPLLALFARIRQRPYGEPYQCGLLHGHGGRCVWFTAGGYLKLAPPILHPLDPLPGPRVGSPDCPACGRPVFGMESDGEVWVLRDEGSEIACGQPVPGGSHERTLRFDCGCEFRELPPDD